MRKIVLILTFLLLSSMCFAQQNDPAYSISYPINNQFPQNAVPTGRDFNVILTTSRIQGNFVINVDVGPAEYVSISVAFDQNLFGQVVRNGNVLSIPVNDLEGATVHMNLKLRLPNTVCNNISIPITSNIVNPLINSSTDINITSTKSNNVGVHIFGVANGTLNYGQTITYQVYTDNSSIDGYVLGQVNHQLFLPSWAQVVGVFKDQDGTNPITYSTPSTTIVNTKIVDWTRDDVANTYKYSYIIVNYPCNSNNIDITFPIKAKITGNLPCSNAGGFEKESNIITTTFQSQVNNCSEQEILTMTNAIVPCPSCTNNSFDATINLGLLPSTNAINTLEFTIDLDPRIDIDSQASVSLPAASPFQNVLPQNVWSISYSSDGVIFFTDFNSNASKIKFTFNSTSGVGLIQNIINRISFIIPSKFVNDQVSSSTALLYVSSLKVNNTISFSGKQLTKSINKCNLNISITKELRKINTSESFVTNIDGNLGEEFTFKYAIYNYNTSQSNLKLVNKINEDLIFTGGLKLSYNNYSIQVPSVTSNPTSVEFNYQTPSLSVYISNNNELIIENLFFPEGQYCNGISTIPFIIEFNVKVKLNLEITTEDLVLNNNVKLFQEDNNVTPTSGLINYINYPIITIKSLPGFSARMYVKCPTTNEWTDDVNGGIDAKKGEQIFYKIKFINFGTTTIQLAKMINIRPQVDDGRGSDFDIFYNCFLPIVKKRIITGDNSYGYEYIDITSANTITYSSSLNQSSGSEPCNAENSKMMFINFNNLPVDKQKLKPNEFIEIYYKADIEEQSPLGSAYTTAAIKSYGINGLEIDSPSCNNIKVNIVSQKGCIPDPCIYCASFDLKNEEKYLISGWVKEVSPTTSGYSSIDITFLDTNDNTIAIDQNLSFYPSGKVIDGWQRIMGEFVVPQGNLENQITLDALRIDLNNSSQDENDKSYFDDIRIIPSKANMKSFVYDQKTQRLMAELDENNYATFYEYDLEGGLVRIKKETEKGVFTIQETRSNSPKKAN